jgi:LysM repeat protein
MNTPSPLVPQGTSPDRGKSGLYFKILMLVSVHTVIIGGMLLLGCKDTKSTTTDTTSTSSDQTNTDISSLPPVNTNYSPAVPPATSSYSATPTPAYTPGTNPMANNLAPAPLPTPAPAPTAAEGHDYVIARGDKLAVIAKKNGVSLKALKEANPGVDPRKLKIGAKLQIPGGGSDTGAVAASGAGVGNAADTGDTTDYVVKAGDMLGRIARTHGTTVAKIKALNGLKTSSIKVGEKLKLPGAKTAEPSTASAPVMTPAPAPVTTPATYASNAQPPAGTH